MQYVQLNCWFDDFFQEIKFRWNSLTTLLIKKNAPNQADNIVKILRMMIKLTFTTDLEGEFVRFTIDSLEWNIKSLIGFNSAHFGPTIFAIKSKDIHWFGVVIFDINNGFERDDFSSIFYDDFWYHSMWVSSFISAKLKWEKSLVCFTNWKKKKK